MPAFRTLSLALVFVAGLTGALCGSQAGGARLPGLKAPLVYGGELAGDRELYRVSLYLSASMAFVLREEFVRPGGKSSGWERTGVWRQIRDDAFVQLSNASGLRRLLNVSASGNLYLGMQFSNGEQATVLLRPKPSTPPEYEISGFLRRRAGAPFLEDADSGLEYRLLPGNALEAFLNADAAEKDASAPVRARVAEAPESGIPPALHVRAMQRIPTKKQRGTPDPAGTFLEHVAGKHWKITRLGRESPSFMCVLRFIPGRGKHEGRVDCFDGERRLSGEYSLRHEAFTLSVADAAAPLNSLFSRTRSWRLVGEALELWDGKGPAAFLEQER